MADSGITIRDGSGRRIRANDLARDITKKAPGGARGDMVKLAKAVEAPARKRLLKHMSDEVPVDTGKLKKSIGALSRVTADPDGATLEIEGAARWYGRLAGGGKWYQKAKEKLVADVQRIVKTEFKKL